MLDSLFFYSVLMKEVRCLDRSWTHGFYWSTGGCSEGNVL